MDDSLSKSSIRGASPQPGEAPRSLSGKLKRWRKPLFSLCLLAGGVLVWQFVTADEPEPELASARPVGIEVQDLQSLLVRKEGKRLWEMQAARIKVAADGSQTVAEQMSRGVLYKNEKPYLILKAPKVTLKNSTNDVVVSGGLHMEGPEQLSLNTPTADWSHRTQLLTCPKPVQGKLKSLNFSFPKLVLSAKAGTISSSGPVEVTGKGIRIRGQKVEADISTRVVKMTGETVMTFYPQQLATTKSTPAPVN